MNIHPHSGYLNTNFRVFVSGADTESFRLILKSDDGDIEIRNEVVSPGIPYSFQMPIPGKFIVECSDGKEIPLIVEDGYKFGGGHFKKAFIFDNCPWLFIVMHDRTYFYNRDTAESYVETVSPDEIIEVNRDFVFFKNNTELTLYSLIAQKPILDIKDLVYYNHDSILWREQEDGETILSLYSLRYEEVVWRDEVEQFDISKEDNSLIYSTYNDVLIRDLTNEFEYRSISQKLCGDVVNIIAPATVICYGRNRDGNFLNVYDIKADEIVKQINIRGELAKIGHNKLIDIEDRKKSIKDFKFPDSTYPEFFIGAFYEEFVFYPCGWDVFYTQRSIHITKDKEVNFLTQTEEFYLHACKKEVNQEVYGHFLHIELYENTICLYSNIEYFVSNKISSAAGYGTDGYIYVKDKNIFLEKERKIYKLNPRGYWSYFKLGQFDFSYFNQFGAIRDKSNDKFISSDGRFIGFFERATYGYSGCLHTSRYHIFSGGRSLSAKIERYPSYLTQSLKIGLKVDKGGVRLFTFDGKEFIESSILEDIFDTSKFEDVLLNQDGKSIMYRRDDNAIVMNIEDNTTDIYENVSFIKHTNGCRPLFTTPSSLQPRLINPITRQYIDSRDMLRFKFVSPDGKFYADTKLSAYTEYYYRQDNSQISRDDYLELYRKFSYPKDVGQSSEEWRNVTELRKQFILEHIEYLKERYNNSLQKDPSGELLIKKLIDAEDRSGTHAFLQTVIYAKGMACIRRSDDDSIVAKIELGEPLTYINYVSFSYDSRYVAITGFRDGGYFDKGVLVVYDMLLNKVVRNICTQRAIWVASFSKSNALASYTSDPDTYFIQDVTKCETVEIDDIPSINCINQSSIAIENSNFLTFSPDGEFFALSDQGYIPKYGYEDEINYNWGHQPSSLVEIRMSKCPKEVIYKYNDISDCGIADVNTRYKKETSIASVSFSNNNKRLMMVGTDGVVIIRNLHLVTIKK